MGAKLVWALDCSVPPGSQANLAESSMGLAHVEFGGVFLLGPPVVPFYPFWVGRVPLLK